MSQELEIDTIIANFHPQTDQQIKTSTANIYHLIHEYELWLYEKDMYDETASKKISNWRKQIIQKINLYKTKEVKEIKTQESGLEEIVTLVSRQITKADENTLGMEKSSIKLKSLNYTSKDLQKEIVKAKNMLMKKRTIMEKEVLMIKFALFVFITVCIAIVVDKLRK